MFHPFICNSVVTHIKTWWTNKKNDLTENRFEAFICICLLTCKKLVVFQTFGECKSIHVIEFLDRSLPFLSWQVQDYISVKYTNTKTTVMWFHDQTLTQTAACKLQTTDCIQITSVIYLPHLTKTTKIVYPCQRQ